MKRVIAKWLNKPPEETVTCNIFDDLLICREHVGFIPKKYPRDRYMICKRGPCRGYAVNANGTFTELNLQFSSDGEYFIFDEAAELYEWMK